MGPSPLGGLAVDLRAFLPPLAAATGQRDQDLLERDVRLHLFLKELMADSVLTGQLQFKGGTCLAKCFIDYLRFSEDLDFTWRSQPVEGSGSGKLRRKPFDELRRDVASRVKGAAKRAELTKRPIGGTKVDRAGELLTMWFTYESVVGGERTIKFEVSFRELAQRKPVQLKANGLLKGATPGALRLADEALATAYNTPVTVTSYDVREIQAEKARAFLTRGAVRGRDFLDLYELDRIGHRIEDAVTDAAAKVAYSIAHWDRYAINPRWKEQMERVVKDAEADRLALRPVNGQNLERFAARLTNAMERVVATANAPKHAKPPANAS